MIEDKMQSLDESANENVCFPVDQNTCYLYRLANLP